MPCLVSGKRLNQIYSGCFWTESEFNVCVLRMGEKGEIGNETRHLKKNLIEFNLHSIHCNLQCSTFSIDLKLGGDCYKDDSQSWKSSMGVFSRIKKGPMFQPVGDILTAFDHSVKEGGEIQYCAPPMETAVN